MSLSETAAADGRFVSVEPGRAASGAAAVVDLEGRTIEELGSIGAGNAADLLIVDGDPLEEIKLLIAGIVAVAPGGRAIRDDLGILDELRTTRQTPRCTTTSIVFHGRATRAAG